ncbi:hypothetical protein SKAU_G00326370 [Synaphobranchus kaupii]|uniref:Endonuclease-reverse transcriptase n=1 Tax=Synaphobranchus kaupii TaxID=118154 RepID=A0A9Q1EPT0_SYNKA|nr:hypothetical protein SKAU_G00326370 [Synaphobranchus kaupii]
MQEKTNTVAVNSVRLGLNVHKGKSKVLKVNTDNVTPITLEGDVLEEVESFTYLGSIVDKLGGTDADVKVRIETWRTTVTAMKRTQTFTNTCLRRILRISRPDIFSNQELRQRIRQHPVEEEILRRCWRWISHTLRKPASSTTRYALFWNPQGKRKRGRLRNTWRHDLEADMKRTGHTWEQLEKLAQDRDAWRAFFRGLCPKLGHRHK